MRKLLEQVPNLKSHCVPQPPAVSTAWPPRRPTPRGHALCPAHVPLASRVRSEDREPAQNDRCDRHPSVRVDSLEGKELDNSSGISVAIPPGHRLVAALRGTQCQQRPPQPCWLAPACPAASETASGLGLYLTPKPCERPPRTSGALGFAGRRKRGAPALGVSRLTWDPGSSARPSALRSSTDRQFLTHALVFPSRKAGASALLQAR